jgi:hypothetical protein
LLTAHFRTSSPPSRNLNLPNLHPTHFTLPLSL